MNKDFIRDFFQKYNKLMPELEMYINQDNLVNVRKTLLDMELVYAMFKRKLMKAYQDCIQGT